MLAWNTPLSTTLTTCAVMMCEAGSPVRGAGRGSLRRPVASGRLFGAARVDRPGALRGSVVDEGCRGLPSAPRTALDLPGVDPVEQLRAGGLHRHLRRDDLDRVDRDEVVGVLVRRDPLVEIAHLDVVLAPAPPARE